MPVPHFGHLEGIDCGPCGCKSVTLAVVVDIDALEDRNTLTRTYRPTKRDSPGWSSKETYNRKTSYQSVE